MAGATLALTGWGSILPTLTEPEWAQDAERVCREADARRARADYNTGSITEDEAYLLRALTESLQARVVIEVGTFIGTSTMAMALSSCVESVYTCDASNDCLPATSVVTVFPHVSSTVMLRALAAKGVLADLCFFDGVLQPDDLPLLSKVCAESVVFALHDYNYGPKRRKNGAMATVPRKGIGNADLLRRRWPSHVVWEPMTGTTLAALVPEWAA